MGLCRPFPLPAGRRPRLVKRLFLLSLFFGVSCAALYAAPPAGLVVEGQEVVYDHDYKNIEATGNVVMTYQGVTLNAQVLKYSVNRKQISIPSAFLMSRKTQTLAAQNFNYDMGRQNGQAYSIRGFLHPWYITGERVHVGPNKIVIHHAGLTTCDSPTPHYQIQSLRIEIYPREGVFAAFDNQLSFSPLPPVWIPTYIHRSGKNNGGASAPVPKLGATAREGWFIKQSLPYFFSPTTNGEIEVGELTRLGMMIGITHHYSPTIAHHLTGSAYWYGRDGLGGGLRLDWAPFLAEESSAPSPSPTFGWMTSFIENNTTVAATSPLDLSFFWLYNELIEDSRVDRRPGMELTLQPLYLGDTGITLSETAETGLLQERDIDYQLTEAYRTVLRTELSRKVSIFSRMDLDISLIHDGRWYDRAPSWQRMHAQFSTAFDTFLHPKLGLAKRLGGSGISPFKFEQRYALEDDEVSLELSDRWGDFSGAIKGRYALNVQRVVSAETTLGYLFHCWRALVTWQPVNGQLSFGMELTQ